MGAFLKIVGLLAKYGTKAVNWAWANKGTVLNWINAGQAIDWIVSRIRKLVGV